MDTIIELDRVWRIHGSGHTAVEALREVSLTAGAGELVAVMGPSGSGKSTLLNLVGGLDRPTTGEVSVLGQQLSRLGSEALASLRRRAVGYVFQELNLLPGLTAVENVALPLELDGARPRQARAGALVALDRLAVADLGERFPDDLSGGEQQRVAIARALVGERRVVLADEPTGALDSVTGESVMRALRRSCDEDGAAGILVTHDAAHAAWADRIVFLRDGEVVDGTSGAMPDLSVTPVVGR